MLRKNSKKLFSVSQIFTSMFLMINVQEDLRNNKSVEFGLTVTNKYMIYDYFSKSCSLGYNDNISSKNVYMYLK